MSHEHVAQHSTMTFTAGAQPAAAHDLAVAKSPSATRAEPQGNLPPLSASARLHAQGRRIAQLRAMAPNRGEAVSATSERNQSIAERTFAGQLASEQVRMQPLRMDLKSESLAPLAAQLQAIRAPGQRPLAKALQSGTAHVRDAHLHAEGLSPAGEGQLGRAVASLGTQQAQLQTRGAEFRVMAKLNPWLEVIGGKILNVDNGPKNKKKGLGWVWASKGDLKAAGIDPDNPVGSAWSTTGGGGTAAPTVPTPAYSVPSVTYGNFSLPPSFHSLPAHQLPSVPTGYAYTGGPSAGADWSVYRDPVQVPASPVWDIHAEDQGGRLTYTSYEEDPTSTSATPPTRVMSAFAQTAPSGGGYGGSRSYPMSTSDYTDSSGKKWGRGHTVDHFDGSKTTTTSGWNYVPEDPYFNEGARNHLVQGIRRGGGGSYVARYDYSATPDRVDDETPIPTTEHFSTFDSAGAHTYYEVPNLSYPSSRKTAAADPYKKPSGSAPEPMTF